MNVLLATTGTSGDVLPFLGLGAVLRARGHHVTVFANAHFEPHARRAGLDHVSVGDASAYRDLTRSAFMGATGADALRCLLARDGDEEHEGRPFGRFVRYVREEVRPLYQRIAARVEPGRTLVLAHAFSVGALVAHEKLGVPFGVAHLAPSILASAHQPLGLQSDRARWVERAINRSAWRVTLRLLDRLAKPPVDALRAELDLPPAPIFERAHELLIGLFPEWFAPRLPDWPEGLVLSDFPRYEDAGAFTDVERSAFERFMASGERPVVLTAGSGNSHARDFFEAGLEACVRLGKRALVLTPHREHVPHPLPESARQVAFVPFREALAKAAAILHHGGIGTCAQAFAAGIPQLVVPMSSIYDQTNNGLRVERLGAGLTVSRARFRGDAAASATKALLASDAIRDRCRAIARTLASAGGLGSAVLAIERHFAASLEGAHAGVAP